MLAPSDLEALHLNMEDSSEMRSAHSALHSVLFINCFTNSRIEKQR